MNKERKKKCRPEYLKNYKDISLQADSVFTFSPLTTQNLRHRNTHPRYSGLHKHNSLNSDFKEDMPRS